MIKIGTTIVSPQTGEQLTFLSTKDSSNGELFRAELVVQPGSYVVKSHIHPLQEESFVVLEGSYGWRIGKETGVAGPGTTLVCPPGVPHSQWKQVTCPCGSITSTARRSHQPRCFSRRSSGSVATGSSLLQATSPYCRRQYCWRRWATSYVRPFHRYGHKGSSLPRWRLSGGGVVIELAIRSTDRRKPHPKRFKLSSDPSL
jgi:uncharacterized RmlC-like cupin family protein